MQRFKHTMLAMKKAEYGQYVTIGDAVRNTDKALKEFQRNAKKIAAERIVYFTAFMNMAHSLQSLSEEDKRLFVMTMYDLDPSKHSYHIERNTKD